MPFDSIDETLRKAFETSWKRGRPEPIDRFLPPAEDAKYLPTLEELVHIELEFRWKDWRKTRHSADTVAPAHTATQEDAGPLRVEYGRKTDRLPGESSGEGFVSFGVAF